MKTIPNLFTYATSELSQDAFLAWFISWADPAYKSHNNNLHNCASSFVIKLLDQNNSYLIHELKVETQFKNIDVYCIVNNEYFIIIEDKKGTQEHSDQLIRYKNIIEQTEEYSRLKLVLIYYKMEEQSDLSNVTKADYSHFTRDAMIKILKTYADKTFASKSNEILLDYYKHLILLDNNINSYKTKSLNRWDKYSWQGLFSKLQHPLKGQFGYVPNASGGFWGFWWNSKSLSHSTGSYDHYLQLEEHKCVIKLHIEEPSSREVIRNEYREILFQTCNEKGIDIVKYGRTGKYMGIALFKNNYLSFNPNKQLDLEITIKILKQYTLLINTVHRKLQNPNNNI